MLKINTFDEIFIPFLTACLVYLSLPFFLVILRDLLFAFEPQISFLLLSTHSVYVIIYCVCLFSHISIVAPSTDANGDVMMG